MDWGVIKTPKEDLHAQRLHGIHQTLEELVTVLKPDIAVVEQIFFFRNATTMVPVCQARGVILLALHAAGLPVHEYTPMQVKMNLTGYGKASKREVQEMVQHLLGMDELPRPDDAADALGIALTWGFDQGTVNLLARTSM